mmetsp:Transcript_23049/g.63919  ORF Transcript_23049/g.63919 Transcript_23049/m.63919 type:complete len:386 (+) Transcript_23049:353-1510(+)
MFVRRKQLLPTLFVVFEYLLMLQVPGIVAFAESRRYDADNRLEKTTVAIAATETIPDPTMTSLETRTMLHLRLYLVRHGESDANQRGIFAGQLDSPLTEHGRIEAKSLGERCRLFPPASRGRGQNQEQRRRCRFDRVYSSDLSRAHETCTLILEGLRKRGPGDPDFDASNDERMVTSGPPTLCDVRLDSRLRERSYGTLQGMPWKSNRDETDKLWRDTHGRDEVPPKWESDHDIWVRVKDFLAELIEEELALGMTVVSDDHDHDGRASGRDRGPTEILISSHSGVLRQIMMQLVGVDKLQRMGATFDAKRKFKLITPNTSLTILDLVIPREEGDKCSSQQDKCTAEGESPRDDDEDPNGLPGVQVDIKMFANTDHLNGDVRMHDD